MELLRVTPEIRDRLHRRRTGADDRNPLIGQAVEFRLLPAAAGVVVVPTRGVEDLALERRQSGNRSEEHTSELQSLMRISYDVLCLKKKTQDSNIRHTLKESIN